MGRESPPRGDTAVGQDMKEIEIDCPCCEARLLIDVRTRTVLRHMLPAERDEFGKPKLDTGRWDAAVQKAKGATEDAFDSALAKERARSKDLDDLFDRAKGRVEERRRELDED